MSSNSNNHSPLWSITGQKTAQGQYVQFKDYGLNENITMPISVTTTGTSSSSSSSSATYYDEQPTSYGYVNYNKSHGKTTTPSSIRPSTLGIKMSSLDSLHHEQDNDVSISRPDLSAVQKIPSSMTEWRSLLNKHPLVVLYIWKQSCVPCANAGKKFEDIARFYTMKYGLGNVLFVKDQIDSEDVQEETTPSYAHWRICEAVPFFMIYIKNKLFTTQTGFIKEDLCQAIEKAGNILLEEEQQQQQELSAATKTTETKPKLEIRRHEEANVVFYTHG
jgi:thiol-disulfide isomerase/thioredoxin